MTQKHYITPSALKGNKQFDSHLQPDPLPLTQAGLDRNFTSETVASPLPYPTPGSAAERRMIAACTLLIDWMEQQQREDGAG